MPVACGDGAGGSLTEQSRRKTVNNRNSVSIAGLGCCAWHVSFLPFKIEVLMRFGSLVIAGKGVWGDMSSGKRLLPACSHVIRLDSHSTNSWARPCYTQVMHRGSSPEKLKVRIWP